MHINIEGLRGYLKTLNRNDFQSNWNKNPDAPIKEGHSIDDIVFFKKDTSKIPFEQVINFGDYFLIDALGNDLSIVKLSRRKYKLPTGRAIRAKYITTVIDDCHEIYGTALNGYWIIPKQFIIS